MTNNNLTIQKFRKDIETTNFLKLYKELFISSDKSILNDNNLFRLFEIAILLINYGDLSLMKLGYRMILRYSIIAGDYKPLYDISIALNYIPIAKFIENKYFENEYIEKHFNTLFLSAYKENYKIEDYYITGGQKEIKDFAEESDRSFVIVAPTSYGKSEIMLSLLNKHLSKKICILVPTKALLSQTQKRILENKNLLNKSRIIVHPDMYRKADNEFIAIFTQERLLRLLKRDETLIFDTVFIDEAHNLLENDHRSILLTVYNDAY